MPIFLLEHLDGCTPLEPCASCEAAAFLRSKLSAEDFEELLRMAKGSSPNSSRAVVGLDVPISVLEPLSVRLRRGLLHDNKKTIRDVVAMTPSEVLRVFNLGRRSLRELEQALARVGHRLAER